MKRDPRLQALSADHHHALVLARRIERGSGDVALVRAAFDAELAPHFGIEEDVLLPALREANQNDLVDRVLAEHALLRALLADAERGAEGALAAFGNLLAEHVRFEERELFQACEACLSNDVLGRAALRSTKRDA